MNKLRIIISKDNIGNLGSFVFLLLFTLFLSLIFVQLLFKNVWVVINPIVEGFLYFFSNVSLESKTWRHILTSVTTGSFKVIILPLFVVLFFDQELYRVVTCSDSGYVPFKLSNLTALIQVADRNCKEHGNAYTCRTNEAHLVVLHYLVLFWLFASILDEKTTC